jgi:hypothetical protein
MEPVVVFNTFNVAEAEIIKSMLEAAGLHAEVTQATSALTTEGYSMATGGIRVVVPPSEAEEARALIAAKGPDE